MIDTYFEIGDSHLNCEDYALHGTIDSMEYGIIADGCSSAEHSEIGAQILCHVARYYIEFYYQTGIFFKLPLRDMVLLLEGSIRKRADELRKLYPITPEALQATLMAIIKIKNTNFLFVWGDGIVIERYASPDNHSIRQNLITKIEYAENTPFYLVTDEKRYKSFFKSKGIEEPKKIIETFTNDQKRHETEGHFNLPYMFKFDKEINLKSITICTDGILSYMNENKKPIDFLTIAPEFTKFKSTTGEFVKRRMSFFKKSVDKKQWTHYDDIATATIIME